MVLAMIWGKTGSVAVGVCALAFWIAACSSRGEPSPMSMDEPDETKLCESDADCDDGRFCNGGEECDPSDSSAGKDGCINVAGACAKSESCNEEDDVCESLGDCENPDKDGDDAISEQCGGDDCDDDDPDRYPGNAEVCDAVHRDEDCEAATVGPDLDDDGYFDEECCNIVGDDLNCGDDCDDSSGTVNVDAKEACNSVDDNCDGEVDEGVLETYYKDDDGDDFGTVADTLTGCILPAGYSLAKGDCNDNAVGVFPGATEICNGEDTDCDTVPDNPVGGCDCLAGTPPRTCGPLEDGGGGAFETRGSCETGTQQCLGGTWANSCNGAIFPAEETCDGLDQDCDGDVDDGASDQTTYRFDSDGDGFGVSSTTELACPGQESPQYVSEARLDCNDVDSDVNPDATEVCNGVNDDCDAATDESPAVSSCGNATGVTYACQSGGVCKITGCPTNTGNCDGNYQTGCNINLLTARTHCGVCGKTCSLQCSNGGCDDVVSLALGVKHACGIRTGGGVVCWGANDKGQLGNGTVVPSASPVPVSIVKNVIALAAGSEHTCAVQTDGKIFCWGHNGTGQTGQTATATPQSTPAQVSLAEAGKLVSAGVDSSCTVTVSGAVWCWGNNNVGQLGNGGTAATHSSRKVRDPDLEPADQTQILDAVAIASGGEFSCVVRAGGTVDCWGKNLSGQLGDGVTNHGDTPCITNGEDCSRIAVSVQNHTGTGTLSGVVQLAAGSKGSHMCARTATNVYCWGENNLKQAANSADAVVSPPASVAGVSSLLAVGSDHSCAKLANGELHCWGSNDRGQLGRGSTAAGGFAPAVVPSFPGTTNVAAGERFTCAVNASGVTYCWGADESTQLGNGSPGTDVTVPSQILPL